jgi:hypothetical protein
MKTTLKRRIGCWFHERKDAEVVLRVPLVAKRLGRHWLDLCNRHETISVDTVAGGRICHWADSSPLTVAKFFPEVGGRLMHRCLKDWTVRFQDIESAPVPSTPDVTFVVGVRGTGRLPQFRATLSSLLAQEGCSCEVVVVEQSFRREFESMLPGSVRYEHLQLESPDMPFNRSWALNRGARCATGRIVILHDADMAAPAGFAAAVRDTLDRGFEAMRLARFIFYLSQAESEVAWTSHSLSHVRRVDRVVQNNPTPIALTRDAYLKIGGHDESFYAWGGEDNDFLDRARTLKIVEGTFLPLFHLWHPEAPNRSGDRNAGLLAARRALPIGERIQELTRREWGNQDPSVAWRSN